MGTSSDHKGRSGGAWTPYKHAATGFAKNGGRNRAALALSRHVGAMGGAAAAASSARSGRAVGSRAGRFLSGFASVGLDQTLDEIGLDHLVGADRYEVVTALVDYIAGDGDSRDAAAARDAACDLIDALFGDVSDYEELVEVEVDGPEVERLLLLFLTKYIINRAEIIAERINRYADVQQALAREGEIRDFISAMLMLQLSEVDPLAVDWDGEQGAQILQVTFDAVYAQLEASAR